MKTEKIPHTLELDEKIELQSIGWALQRISWVMIAVFIVLASLGLFGNGPLSYQERYKNGSGVEFEKYLRNGSVHEVIFAGDSIKDESLIIKIPQSYF